jgi:hypothetical protein
VGTLIDAPDYETLFEAPLDRDEAQLGLGEARRRAEAAIIGDRDFRLFWRANRIALAKGRPTKVEGGADAEPGRDYWDVPLTCAIQSHPECRFRWSRLILDFTPTRDGLIRDMEPKEVVGDRPVEYKTTVGVGLKFEVLKKVLQVEPKMEYTTARTVYYPRIVAVGNSFRKGYWNFLAMGDEYLHVNKELRLLVSAPCGTPVVARFKLQAKVTLAGLPGEIPLLARTGAIEETYQLT